MPGPAVAKVTDPQVQALMELERRGQLPDDLKGQLDIARRQGVAPPLKGDPNNGAIDKATDIFDSINKAHADTGWTTTGFGGSLFGGVPGTAGKDLRGYVNSIKANLAFDQLAQMRANSPTGGALGSVSDAEEKLLSGSVADLDPAQSSEVFSQNLEKVRNHYRQWLKGLGYSDDQIAAANGGTHPITGAAAADAKPHDPDAHVVRLSAPSLSGAPPPPSPTSPPSGGGPMPSNGSEAPMQSAGLNQYARPGVVEPQAVISADGSSEIITAKDKAFAADAQRLLDTPGTTIEDYKALAQHYGGVQSDDVFKHVQALLDYRDKGGKGAKIVPSATIKSGPSTASAISNSALGAGVVNAGEAVSSGLLPKAIGAANAVADKFNGDQRSFGDVYANDLEDVHTRIDAVSKAHPYAALAGQVVGFAGSEAALGAAAARLGGKAALNGISRLITTSDRAAVSARRVLAPIISDAGVGAAYGAGSQDNLADVPGGVLEGAATSVVGGVIGRGAVKGVGNVISPSVGALGSLYKAGVRPTLGQRFANSGRAGAALNYVEEASQSLPLVGMLPRAARQNAREQFERGAFDSALGELDGIPGVASSLPKDAKLGTQPHAFMQEQFDKAYDQARSGMKFVPDKPYMAELQKFANDLSNGVLNDGQVQQVRQILNRAVQTRLQAQGGQLTGDAYKQSASEVEKAARKLSGSEPLVADALRQYRDIFDGAARRNSDPAAVAVLDKADAGYAKAVRIEMAAAARGGETGRFSPTQFDSAVQKASGGVRSRAYLRGDALMSDYAEAGKSLVDRLPNSGTADRLMTRELLTGQAMATAPAAALGYASPIGAALTGAVTLPYAPGVERLTRGLLAPSTKKGVTTLGAVIRRNAALGGRAGSPLLLDQVANRGE